MAKSFAADTEKLTVKNVAVSYLDSQPNLPADRSRHAAAGCGNLIYMHGGKHGYRTLSDLWSFNLDQAHWTMHEFPGYSLKPGLSVEHFMVEHNSSLYLISNGLNNHNRSQIQIWRLKDDKWHRCCPPSSSVVPAGRQLAKGAVVGAKLFIFGGVADLSLVPTSELLEFDLDHYSWRLVKTGSDTESASPPAVYDHSCIGHSFRNSLYVFGGLGNRKAQNLLWQYDSLNCLWKCFDHKAYGPTPRHGHAAVCAGNSMFVHGGQRDEVILSDLWQFDLNCKLWTQIALTEPLPITHHALLWHPSKSPQECASTGAATTFVCETDEDWKSENYKRTISQEKLVPSVKEADSILRRLSSRRRKAVTGVINDGIEMSDLDTACKDSTNIRAAFPEDGMYNGVSQKPKVHRGHLLIVGGDTHKIEKHLRLQTIEIPSTFHL